MATHTFTYNNSAGNAQRAARHRRRVGASALWAMLAALALACFAPPPQAARADGVTYSDNKRTFKVGILLLDSTTVNGQTGRGPENPDPFVFYIADARTDVKPVNWELVNPLAPRTVTTEIFNRWSQNGADPNRGRDPGHPYQVGQKVEKNMAAYWEVSLNNTSAADLLQYDLLFITNHRDVGMTPVEKEKLRKLVDAGGIVWIEDCGNMRLRPDGPFFLENLQFRSEGSGANAGPYIFRPDHPLLTNPYKLSFKEISNLGDKNYANFYMSSVLASDDVPLGTDVPRGTAARGLQYLPQPQTLVNVVGNRGTATDGAGLTSMPYIAAGNYGSGAVIATSSDSGCDINDYAGGANVGSGGNSGAYCGPNIRTAHGEDLKFLYNAVAWGSANNSERRNGRRTANSFDSIGAPLVPNFAFTNPTTPNTAIVKSNSSPIIVKGVMYVAGVDSAGNSTVRAYDIQPGSDLDSDGNPDDGIPDLALGYPYDEIWEWTGPAAGNGQPSAPTYADIFTGTLTVDRVFVTLPSGGLVNLPALPRDPTTSRLLPQPAGGDVGTNNVALVGTPATYTAANRGVAPAPTVFGNRVHVVQPDGLVRCVDAATMGNLWTTFDTAPNPQIPPLSTPTLGFVRLAAKSSGTTFADNSSGSTNDLMLYVPSQLTDTSGTVQSGKVKTYFLGTRNEVQTQLIGQGIIATRVANGAKDQYFIAPARPTGYTGAYPYQDPVARVYANENDVNGVFHTREENYAAGRVSTVWKATFLPGTGPGGYPDGRVEVKKADGTLAQGSDRVMIAADYDVMYIVGGNKPPQISGDGARDNAQLNIPQFAGGLDTVPISTDDLLLFGVNQTTPNNTAAGSYPVMYAVNDQEFLGGGSRTPWRFVIHDGYANVSVNGQPISDLPVLRNRLRFDSNWPLTDSASYAQLAGGYPLAEPITKAKMVGSPIVSNNGVTYVLAKATSVYNTNANNPNGDVTVLMAFKSNPDITLVLPDGDTFEPGSLNVSQLDALSYDPTQGTGDTVSTQVNPVQFTTNTARDRVTVTSFQQTGGGQYLSASQTFVLRYTPTGTANTKTVIVPPIAEAPDGAFGTPFNPNSDTTVRNAASQVSPLLWYYVLPYAPLSSPTLIGDFIYFTQNRFIRDASGALANVSGVVAVEADPASGDGTIRPAEQIRNVAASINDGTGFKTVDSHVRWINQNFVGKNGYAFSSAPPVGGQGVLALNSDQGTFSFQEGLTLIAEANRVLEVDAGGAATWSLDTTLYDQVVGGKLPVYNFGGGTVADPDPDLYRGRQSLVRKPLARPSLARKLGNADYLIADTGNNRIVRVDRSGRLLWNLDKISDPFGVLASGDPFTLLDPTDVYFYLTRSYDAAGVPNGYEAHYLIADAGNFRIVEVADFYDNNGAIRDITGFDGTVVTGEHIAVWTTRTTTNEGRSLRFQNIRGFVGEGTGGDAGLYGFPYLVAIVGNASTSGDGILQSDSAGGSVVVLNYKPFNTQFVLRDATGATTSLRRFWPDPSLPAPPPTDPARKSEPAGGGTVTQAINDIVIVIGGAERIKRITRPTFLDTITQNGVRQYILCDADGVYTVVPETVTNGSVTRTRFRATWMFQQADYDTINGIVNDGSPNAGNPILGGRLAYPTSLTPAQALAGAPRFVPTSVKRLTNGNYLLTNNGANDSPFFEGRRFVGEVLEIAPNGPQVAGDTARGGAFAGFSAPRLIGKGTGPSATNVQQMGVKSNTSLMEQPTSADRL